MCHVQPSQGLHGTSTLRLYLLPTRGPTNVNFLLLLVSSLPFWDPHLLSELRRDLTSSNRSSQLFQNSSPQNISRADQLPELGMKEEAHRW